MSEEKVQDDDARWEYQAPQFVDFTNLDNEDQGADSFFDVDMESGSRVSQMFGPGGGKISEEFKPANMETVEEGKEPSPVTTEEKPGSRKPKPSNMVRSWGFKVQKGQPGNGNAGFSSKSSSSMTGKGAKQTNQSRPPSQPMHQETDSPLRRALRQDTPTRRSLREAVTKTVNSVRNSPHLKRLGTNLEAPRLTAVDRNLASGGAGRLRTRSKSPGHALAMPHTPDVMRKFKNKLKAVGAKEIDDLKLKKQPSTQNKEQRPVKPSQPVLKAAVSLTRPAEFKFATASRSKESRRRSMSVPDAPNFTSMLRSYNKPTATRSSVNKELTKPVPFPRAESRKRRLSEETEGKDRFKSMAEQVSKFQKGTPDRFRTKPRGRSSSVGPHSMRLRSQSPNLTVPKTPQLATKGRSRPPQILSQAEREELELEEARRNQFHAKQVGETLPKFKYGEVERRPCTKPEPFNLTEPAHKPFAQPQTLDNQIAFHPKPLNKKLLQGPLGVPEKKAIPVVEPESPAFALKQRMATRRQVLEPQVEPERIVKAKPVPHYGVPVALPLANKNATVPKPFSFSERDQMSAIAKEERIKKLLEEEKAAREFHAKPIAKGVENPRLPEKKPLPTTALAPFKMNIEERLETRINKWQEEINKELEEQKKAAIFKANEPKVLTKAPFVPKPADKHLTEISNFTHHSERRAEERRGYEMEKKKKEVDLDAAKRQREERRKREEEEEIARLRKQNVHRAQPIRGYKPVEIKPSDKPLTQPISPRLAARNNRTNATFNKTSSSANSSQ